MKRPDLFICVDSANLTSLKETFGIEKINSNEDYWLFITNFIQNCEWWNSPRPKGSDEEQRAWDGRVAMLDAIHYEKH